LAYHEGTQMLLIWNLIDGCDIYSLKDQRLIHIHHFHLKIRRNHICQVQFDSDRKIGITGSDNGQLLLWDIASGQLAQALQHGEGIH